MILDFERIAVMDKGDIVEIENPKLLAEEAGTRLGVLVKAGLSKTKP